MAKIISVFLIVSAAFWGAFSAAASDQPDLQTWLVELRQDARDAGISEATLDGSAYRRSTHPAGHRT